MLNLILNGLPTIIQNLWKNPAWRPSRPGALKAFRNQSPCLISSSKTRLHKLRLSSLERAACHVEGWGGMIEDYTKLEVKSFTKPPFDIIHRSIFTQNLFPHLILIQEIRFCCLFTMVIMWWKIVFRSPATRQMTWVFCTQSSSSWFKMFSSSLWSSFSRTTKEWEGQLAMAFWIPLRLAIILFFLPKIFPKWFLFQTVAFLANQSMAICKGNAQPQASETILEKDKSDNQKLWKMKGLGRWTPLLGLDSKMTRQWSDGQWVRWVTLAFVKVVHQLGLVKNLSILSWTRSKMSLRFVQVNLGPLKPKSTILHVSRHSLKSRDLLALINLPPYLSPSTRTSLKSLAIT